MSKIVSVLAVDQWVLAGFGDNETGQDKALENQSRTKLTGLVMYSIRQAERSTD